MKRVILAIIAVFVVWEIMDFVIHGVILQSAYASQPAIWRPMAEMKMGVMYVAVLISAASFVVIYARFFRVRNLAAGLQYGLIFGLGAGIAMGYGTYAVIPVPYSMALTWFLGTLLEAVAGGLLTGLIVRD